MIDQFKNPRKYALFMLVIVLIGFLLGLAIALVFNYFHIYVPPAPDVY